MWYNSRWKVNFYKNIKKLNGLLEKDELLLIDAGKISREIACEKALTEYEKYRIQ